MDILLASEFKSGYISLLGNLYPATRPHINLYFFFILVAEYIRDIGPYSYRLAIKYRMENVLSDQGIPILLTLFMCPVVVRVA